MDKVYSIIKDNYENIKIKYYSNYNILIIKCSKLKQQIIDLKKILKILIFEIQSKHIKKDSIILEFEDKDFLDVKMEELLNIMKLTKTSHYFNLVTKKKTLDNTIIDQLNSIKAKYVGLNINKQISIKAGDSYE